MRADGLEVVGRDAPAADEGEADAAVADGLDEGHRLESGYGARMTVHVAGGLDFATGGGGAIMR